MRKCFQVAPQSTSRRLTDVFCSYDARLRIRDGAMNFTKNLCTDHYPTLSTRVKRGTVQTMTAPQGLIAKDTLGYVDNGTLFFGGRETGVTGLTEGEKQLVGMGAYIVIFPDKVYCNTEDPTDFGSLEASFESSGEIVYTLCRADGTDYESVQVGDTEPEDASVELWISTAGGTSVAMSWSASYGNWVELGTVYTKLTFTSQGTIPAAFKEGDGVTIAGSTFSEANGEKILYAVGGSGETGNEENDWIVIVGLLENSFSQTSGSVTIDRKTPDMDFVCEAQNRLWGCFYGMKDGQTLNEIYCCALGDFRNWRQYRGLSTDSWAAGVGSDGQWTGAVNYLGSPVFFKEERIHQVGISAVGAHSIQETVCRGVQKGSHKSALVVNETLYYKSRSDVCAWQGGFPQGVSAALGDAKYGSAAAGAARGKYYISMKDGSDAWHLFVYDTEKGLWSREDDLQVMQFAATDDELYAINAGSRKLLALFGGTGTPEESLSWEAVSGILSFEYPDRKYVSRFDVRMRMEANASAKIYLQYDSDGTWQEKGTLARSTLGTVLLPIRPRRCDHFQIKIAGTGSAEILSIASCLEVGSDA